MTTHVLKCWPAYYDAIQSGLKTFEARRDDRGFQKGDIVELQRTYTDSLHVVETDDRGVPKYRQLFQIGWILNGGNFGIEPGYVVFSLIPMGRDLAERQPAGPIADQREGEG